MNMFQLMENEKYRWSYMTEEQLARRLKKITNPDKLACFIDMAEMRGNDYLFELAGEREADLNLIVETGLLPKGWTASLEIGKGDDIKDSVRDSVANVKKQVTEKWNMEKEKEIDERYLEF